MAAKKPNQQNAAFWQKKNTVTPVSNSEVFSTTTIGKGLSMEGGTIKGDGNVCIDGCFVGEIDITGDLSIGSSGAVYGDISAKCATISGNSKGTVRATGKIHLTATAVVEGTLISNAIVMDEYAVFNGACRMETAVQLPDTRPAKAGGDEESYLEESVVGVG